MTGDEIRRARETRQWTQQQLATRLGVGMRTVGNWERGESVPRSRMGALQELFGIAPDPNETNPLANLSDLALLNELTRRAMERQRS